jgi:NADH:ubiquinone oxidoreductase subunit E
MTTHRATDLDALRTLLTSRPWRGDDTLVLLQAVQQQCGWVPPEAVPLIAEAVNRSRAEVYGVLTFYGDLREAPVGRTVVQICMAEACQAVGCRALAHHAEALLGVTLGSSSSDGRVHLEATYCLGNCALGPSVRVGDTVLGRVSHARFDALIAAQPTAAV